MNQEIRKKVFAMFDGLCAYCGEKISMKGFHVDHVKPLYRGFREKELEQLAARGLTPGTETPDNYFPACAPCNLRKRDSSLEEFRLEIFAQIERLRKYSAQFRLAERFDLIWAEETPPKFFFELVATTPGAKRMKSIER